MRFHKKHFFFGMFTGAALFLAFIFSLPDGRLHLVFCDVGQGDAVYIRTPSNQDMLIDGGPDDRVLTCLGRHMPFFDRTIDVVVLTHPQKDHLQGLISVVERYSIKYFVIGVEGNSTDGYKSLAENIKKKKIPVKNLFTGDSFSLGEVKFDVLWPQKEWVMTHTSDLITGDASTGAQAEMYRSLGWASGRTRKLETEGAVLSLTTNTQLNDFSYFLNLKYRAFSALFPGDGDVHIQPEILKTENILPVTVFKYPHHGSKTAVLPDFLDRLKPFLAIISVGRNSYGHPTSEALQLLSGRGIKTARTDKEGDIEVVSEGRNWQIKRWGIPP